VFFKKKPKKEIRNKKLIGVKSKINTLKVPNVKNNIKYSKNNILSGIGFEPTTFSFSG
jgi:hypothetical protein